MIPDRLTFTTAETVFSTFRGGFGDIWGAANLFLRLSEIRKSPTKIYRPDSRLIEIVKYLKSEGSLTEVSEKPDLLIHSHRDKRLVYRECTFAVPEMIIPWSVVFEFKFFQTKSIYWKPNSSRNIATQFLPRYSNSLKACPSNHIAYFRAWMQDNKYVEKGLGLPLTILENIKCASQSKVFVGVCSGMSHLCHSVGVPVIIVKNKQLKKDITRCHKGNNYQLAKNLIDACKICETYL